MSLINDALKKADEAQKSGSAPPPPPIPMRPATKGKSSFLPVFLLIVFLLAVLSTAAWFLSSWWRINRARLLAKSAEAPAPVAVLTNEPVAAQPTNEVKEPVVATNIVNVTNYVQAKLEGLPLTNILKTLAAVRLQGVFYRPPDSTALINGKSVRVGDKIQGVSVLAIGKDTVTVAFGGVTNVMELK